MLQSDGCYICQPANPNAAEDGCSDCDLAWGMYYEAAYACTRFFDLYPDAEVGLEYAPGFEG